ALKERDAQWRRLAADGLGSCGKKSRGAASSLMEALRDEDRSVRLSAANALAEIQTEAAIPSLVKALEDRDEAVRSAAAQALGRLGPHAASARQGLMRAMQDADKNVRFDARRALEAIERK